MNKFLSLLILSTTISSAFGSFIPVQITEATIVPNQVNGTVTVSLAAAGGSGAGFTFTATDLNGNIPADPTQPNVFPNIATSNSILEFDAADSKNSTNKSTIVLTILTPTTPLFLYSKIDFILQPPCTDNGNVIVQITQTPPGTVFRAFSKIGNSAAQTLPLTQQGASTLVGALANVKATQNFSILITPGATGGTTAAILQATLPIDYPAISFTATSTPASTSTSNDGTITVTATGGTGNYTFVATPPSGKAISVEGAASPATIKGLPAGDYTVTVTDATNPGCSAKPQQVSVEVNPTPPIAGNVLFEFIQTKYC